MFFIVHSNLLLLCNFYYFIFIFMHKVDGFGLFRGGGRREGGNNDIQSCCLNSQ